MKHIVLSMGVLLSSISILAVETPRAVAQDMSNGADNFYRSDAVTLEKVSFRNKLGMQVVGNLFVPKSLDRTAPAPAVIVGHPMGAVKEQSSNLYAQKLAEKGFVTLSFDLPFWGESEGQPRNTVMPELYADAFSAATDFLSTRDEVNAERIGVLGICGSGSFALSAASIDPRMKAIATVSMYDMGAASRDGLRNGVSLEQRREMMAGAIRQRMAEFTGAPVAYTGGTTTELTADTHAIQREFYDFYRTPRGEFTPPGQPDVPMTQPTLASNTAFMNFHPFAAIETISPRPLLFVAGENAHSIEFSEDAFAQAAEPKELVIVPNAGHVDLYDRTALIPFDRLASFFQASLAEKEASLTGN